MPENGDPSPPARSRFRRALLPIWLLVCAGVLALFGYAVWDGLQPVTHVHAVAALSWKDAMATSSRATPATLTGTPLPQPKTGVLVDASPVIEVRSTLDGKVKTVLVQQGQRVHCGQPLLLLSDEEWQCARVHLFGAWQREEARWLCLKEEASELGTPLVDRLQGALMCINDACKHCSMIAPIDGVVRQLNVKPGDRVSASGVSGMEDAALLTLQPGTSFAVIVPLTPDEAFRVGIRRSVRLIPNQQSISPIHGAISEMHGRVVGGEEVFEARIPLPSEVGKDLEPGGRVRVEFLESDREKELRDLAFIPRAALVGQDGDQVAFWVIGADNRLQKRTAKRRTEWDLPGRYAVLGGVLPGEPIVLDPGPSLQVGQRVATE